MNAVFLMSRLSGYFYNAITVFCKEHNIKATIIAYPNKDNAPFVHKETPFFKIINKESFITKSDFLTFIKNINPCLLYISGWNDSFYKYIGEIFKEKIPVVMGMDNQWKGLFKQKIHTLISRITLHSFCNHIWVPGIRQYEYARRLGFKRENILLGLYTANTDYFHSIFNSRKKITPKKLIFIGNMWRDKGVIELIEAFQEIKSDWELLMIGGGPLCEVYKDKFDNVKIIGFVQPHELENHIKEATAFCLPSYHDAWAVVIHEAASAGLPIIATEVCGAITSFVHEGYNGYICKEKSKEELKKSLEKLYSLNTKELERYSKNSYEISKQITPSLWSAKLFSLIK